MRYSFLLEPKFYAYLVTEAAASLRKIVQRYRRQGRLPAHLGHLRWRTDLHLDCPERLSIAPTAIIGQGAVFGVPSWIGEQDPARLIVRDKAYIGSGVELGLTPGAILDIGENTSMHHGCVILGNVAIGRNCIFAYNIYVAAGTHVIQRKPEWLIKDQDEEFSASQPRERTVIEDDVWVGWGVFIKSGATIGRGAVIGANSVVTTDIEPYAIYAGAPAKRIGERLRFEPPARLSALRDEDMPYFYAGFAGDRASLRQSRERRIISCARNPVRVRMRMNGTGTLSIAGNVDSDARHGTISVSINGKQVGTGRVLKGSFEERFDVAAEILAEPIAASGTEVTISTEGIPERSWGIREITWQSGSRSMSGQPGTS